MKDFRKVIELGIKEAEKNYEKLKEQEKLRNNTEIDDENETISFDGDVWTFEEFTEKIEQVYMRGEEMALL